MTGFDAVLRSERPDEEPAVRAVVEAALVDEPVVGELVDALRRSPDWLPGLSFVAELAHGIVGHVLFTRGLLDAPQRLVDVLVLSPVSVSPPHQRQGIGSALIRHGLDEVRRRDDEPLVFLEGDPTFYGRFGFEAAEGIGFRRPSLRIPEPAFQVLRMPSWQPWMTGTLVYPRTFWDLDCVGLRDGVRTDEQPIAGPSRQADHDGPMSPGRPVGLTLYVRDSDAAIAFYQSAFGMRWNPDISSFEFGAYPQDDFFLLSILDPTDEPDHPIGTGHFGYTVHDLEEAHRRALDAGAVEWYPPSDNPGAPRSSGVWDPDGNRVELWQV